MVKGAEGVVELEGEASTESGDGGGVVWVPEPRSKDVDARFRVLRLERPPLLLAAVIETERNGERKMGAFVRDEVREGATEGFKDAGAEPVDWADRKAEGSELTSELVREAEGLTARGGSWDGLEREERAERMLLALGVDTRNQKLMGNAP